jgi:3-dehydroquinate synthase
MQNKINITFGKSAFSKLPKQFSEKKYSRVFILVDNNTNKFCLSDFISITGFDKAEILIMEAGEENKNLQTCENLWKNLSNKGADRNSVLINLGGGVVTDLGGFVACTFKRGIDFYNIPTTLLAMVDASVGGKTGIDLGSLKNQIGVIEEPKQVIIDPIWLNTLPKNEIRSGYAEMLKHGIISSKKYWQTLKELSDLTFSTLKEFIKPSIEIKKEVVLKDPREKKLRKILNFGHTLGHAIESYFLINPNKNKLLHGEAIAIGMILESYLSIHCAGLNFEIARDIRTTFLKNFKKIELSIDDKKEIIKLLKHDKKNIGNKINFVLISSIGKPKIDVQVPEDLFEDAFNFYLSA